MLTEQPKRFVLLTALLLVTTVLVYLPAMRSGYIWDDNHYVQNNKLLRSSDGLWQIWFQIGATDQYYPMTYTTYWLEYHLWKLNPLGYHIVNVILHVLCAVLLWRVLEVLKIPGAWFIAAVFALHPVNVESVAWITQRKNVLSGFFSLSAALLYFRWALISRNKKLYAGALVLFVCALFSKTAICMLPVLFFLVLWWKKQRICWSDVSLLIPFFVISIIFGLLTILIEKDIGATGEQWNLSVVGRFLVAGRSICFYITKLFWPEKLTFIYPRWQIDISVWQQYFYPFAVLVVLAGLWFTRPRIGEAPLVAVLCFACILFPVLGFFDIYFTQYSYVADHWQYLPSIALIVLAVSAIYSVTNRFDRIGKTVRTTIFTLILITFGMLSWIQCHIYMDLETLWRDTLQKNPNSWLAHNNLGRVLVEQYKYKEAIVHCKEVLRLNPNCAEAYNNIGNALLGLNKPVESLDYYRQSLKLNPKYAEAYRNAGVVLTQQNKLKEAIECFDKALQLKPEYFKVYTCMGIALAKQGKIDEAIDCFNVALQNDPYNAQIYYNLGMAYTIRRNLDEAIKNYTKALQIKPDFINARKQIEVILEWRKTGK